MKAALLSLLFIVAAQATVADDRPGEGTSKRELRALQGKWRVSGEFESREGLPRFPIAIGITEAKAELTICGNHLNRRSNSTNSASMRFASSSAKAASTPRRFSMAASRRRRAS